MIASCPFLSGFRKRAVVRSRIREIHPVIKLLQQGKEQAAKAAAAELEKAEEGAAKRREQILAQAEKDCEALKKEAGSRMGKATKAILGRVVGN